MPTLNFGKTGQLVHERDSGSEHGVGDVFGEFGGFDVHHNQTVVVAVERSYMTLMVYSS